MAAAAPKTRTARAPMAPIAAPQQQQQQPRQPEHEQYPAFPSPAPAGFGLSPGPHLYTPTSYYINVACYETLHTGTMVAIGKGRHEDKRVIIDSHFEWFQEQVLEEIRIWKMDFLISQGLPATTNKRRPDDDDPLSGFHGSPDSKKPKAEKHDSEEVESPDDEVNVKGSWRCLYYEEDPETHFHCKEKRYKRVSELRRHIKTHTLPHYCSKCGYRTAEERRLQNHKCEPGNRKKYSPVSEEDRLKHEQLARMGIKVGHMRMILFGKKGDVESVVGDDDTGSSELPSRRPSITMTIQPQPAEFVPANFTAFHPAMPTHPQAQEPNHIAMSQPSPPQIFGSTHLPQQAMHSTSHTPSFQPGSPMPHSPHQGHAAWYYHGHHQQDTGDFVLYPPATYAPHSSPSGQLSDGTSASPSNHNPSPPGHYTHQMPYTSAGQQPSPVVRTNSLNTFLQDVFPEVDGGVVRNRSMPASEIAEMEANLARESKRNSGRGSLMEKSKHFFRFLSTRSQSAPVGGMQGPATTLEHPPPFWRRMSAPPIARSSPTDKKKTEGGVLSGLKKVFAIGIGHPRPAITTAATTNTITTTAVA